MCDGKICSLAQPGWLEVSWVFTAVMMLPALEHGLFKDLPVFVKPGCLRKMFMHDGKICIHDGKVCIHDGWGAHLTELCTKYYDDASTSLDELMVGCFSCVMQELQEGEEGLVSRQPVFVLR
jgi:hypothetical protein